MGGYSSSKALCCTTCTETTPPHKKPNTEQKPSGRRRRSSTCSRTGTGRRGAAPSSDGSRTFQFSDYDYSSARKLATPTTSSATRTPYDIDTMPESFGTQPTHTGSPVALLVPTMVDTVSGKAVIDERALRQIVDSYNYAAHAKADAKDHTHPRTSIHIQRKHRHTDSGTPATGCCERIGDSHSSGTLHHVHSSHSLPPLHASYSAPKQMLCAPLIAAVSDEPTDVCVTQSVPYPFTEASARALCGVLPPAMDPPPPPALFEFGTDVMHSVETTATIESSAGSAAPMGHELDMSLDLLATQFDLTPLAEATPKRVPTTIDILPPPKALTHKSSLDEALTALSKEVCSFTQLSPTPCSSGSDAEMEAVAQVLAERSERYVKRLSQAMCDAGVDSRYSGSLSTRASRSRTLGHSRLRKAVSAEQFIADTDESYEDIMELVKMRSVDRSHLSSSSRRPVIRTGAQQHSYSITPGATAFGFSFPFDESVAADGRQQQCYLKPASTRDGFSLGRRRTDAR